ncbi:hypothetical protein C8Q77DRAFT_1158254 [Trametes polyzona]|nr:hypothetical protein C8Q77DRAFT_1158254 [Trametes polyzona]
MSRPYPPSTRLDSSVEAPVVPERFSYHGRPIPKYYLYEAAPLTEHRRGMRARPNEARDPIYKPRRVEADELACLMDHPSPGPVVRITTQYFEQSGDGQGVTGIMDIHKQEGLRPEYGFLLDLECDPEADINLIASEIPELQDARTNSQSAVTSLRLGMYQDVLFNARRVPSSLGRPPLPQSFQRRSGSDLQHLTRFLSAHVGTHLQQLELVFDFLSPMRSTTGHSTAVPLGQLLFPLMSGHSNDWTVPLSNLTDLSVIAIGLEDLTVRDSDIKQIAVGCPKLRKLRLDVDFGARRDRAVPQRAPLASNSTADYEKSALSIQSLITLSQHTPCLEYLCLPAFVPWCDQRSLGAGWELLKPHTKLKHVSFSTKALREATMSRFSEMVEEERWAGRDDISGESVGLRPGPVEAVGQSCRDDGVAERALVRIDLWGLARLLHRIFPSLSTDDCLRMIYQDYRIKSDRKDVLLFRDPAVRTWGRVLYTLQDYRALGVC